jgi:hypothetical protein
MARIVVLKNPDGGSKPPSVEDSETAFCSD